MFRFYLLLVLSDHSVVSYQKGSPFCFYWREQTKPHSQHGSISLLWSCDDTIFLLIVRKEQLLIILHGVLLVTHRWFLYLVFVFLLGAICTREALRYDFLIAEKVNFHPTLGERPSSRRAELRGLPTMAHFVDVVWLVQVLTVCTFSNG